MEKSTPVGLVVGLGLIFGAIFLGDGWQTFFDPASLLLVVGGTAASLIVNYSFADLSQLPGGMKGLFAFEPPALRDYVRQFSALSGTARREGLLALDRQLGEVEDDLMRFGLEMAVDGVEEDEVCELLDQRIGEEAQRRGLLPKFFTTAGTYCPAFGMIGTLIGLIQMLQNLNDPTKIGAGMATAMITTFYGALFANLIFLPLAAKAKSQAGLTLKTRELVRLGILAIIRGDSPRMIEQRLGLFLQGAEAPDEAEAPAEPVPLARAA